MTTSASRWSSVTGKHITLTGPMKMPLQEINNGRQARPTSSLDMLLNATYCRTDVIEPETLTGCQAVASQNLTLCTTGI